MDLRIIDIHKQYNKRQVVKGISLYLSRGEVVGLLGPNGAGKTTVFSMIVGLTRPTSGQIFLGDQEITGFPMYQRARIGMSYLPQEPSIFQKLTVAENVLAVLEARGGAAYQNQEKLEQFM